MYAILCSLLRANDLMKRPKDAKAYYWDVKRAWTMLGGLDEDEVRRILEEEKP